MMLPKAPIANLSLGSVATLTGLEGIDKFRLYLFKAVAGYWMDGWNTMPTADAAFLIANAGPLATLTFMFAVREAVLFLTFGKWGK